MGSENPNSFFVCVRFDQKFNKFCIFFQIFHFRVDQENRLSNMFPQEVLPQMFANIKSIYKFHAEFLLPQVSIKASQKPIDKLISHNGAILSNSCAFLSSQNIFDMRRPPF